ncbi:MAG: helix-turn-helix domain-containing protein [Acidobacteria bacterium]|nr:MAG: helix-turn-helix domain-containing protein [Acidobacteriota bacterium]REK04493.1 MAG: helix-turn-helix domain-containing protein [Acidobacteriota bacterium]
MDAAVRTAAFYDWEIRGRGWLRWDYPVRLEPPYRPYRVGGLVAGQTRVIDDGQRHSPLSSWVESFTRRQIAPVEDSFDEEVPQEAEALASERTQVLLPVGTGVGLPGILSWLHSLSGVRSAMALEIECSERGIEIYLSGSADDLRFAASQLSLAVPGVVLRSPKHDLPELVGSRPIGDWLVARLGLASEFMVPIAKPISDEPLESLLATMADLVTAGGVGVVQLLFEPVDQPWREQILSAVETPSGKPFFKDAPEVTSEARSKVASPLFAAALRVAVASDTHEELVSRLSRVAGSLSFARDLGSNELIIVSVERDVEPLMEIVDRVTTWSGMLLSAEELGILTKMPGKDVALEALVRPLERTKAAPSMVTGSGNLVGANEHLDALSDVRLSDSDRTKHVHVLGASGVGKSTLLVRMILNDLEAGHGVGVLDPHGDLVREVASRLPETRLRDTALFDPSSSGPVVGWNVLEARSDTEREMLTSDLVGVFRRLSTSWGDQMNAVLANAMMVFLEEEVDGTLVDLRQFLADPSIRRSVLGQVSDPMVRSFWETEFPLIEKRRPQAPILTRLDAFLRSRAVRRVLNVRQPKLDFQRLLDDGGVFLANLSMGSIGEDNAALLGSLLVSRFHQVSLMRGQQGEGDRRPFFLYIDEFHHVATSSMASLFSGARKFRLGLTLAHQDLYQLKSAARELERSLLANAHTRICFRLGDDDARAMDKGFSFFTADDLMNLKVGQAICRVGMRNDDFNLATERLPRVSREEAADRVERVHSHSQGRWGVEEVALRDQPAEETSDARSESRGSNPDPPAESKDRPPRKSSPEPEEEPSLSKALLDFLESVAREPLLGVRERNARLGLSAWDGSQRKSELLEDELVREVEINPGGRGSQFKLLELTTKGRDVLSKYEIQTTTGLGRGGVAHQWWVQHVASHLAERGVKATTEDESMGARVDLLAMIDRKRTAVEIDFRQEQAIHNVRKDAEAGFKHIVSLVDGFEVADSVRAAVSDLETATVAVADLREFESVLESPAPPNQNKEPGGSRRRRQAKQARPQPVPIVLEGGVLDTPMAASYLGLSPATLETMRSRGGGPRFSKLGRRVVYRREELDRWLEERSQRSTSDQ